VAFKTHADHKMSANVITLYSQTVHVNSFPLECEKSIMKALVWV